MIRAQDTHADDLVLSQSIPHSVDDPRVVEAVEKYRASLDAGDAPDRQQLLDKFPQLAAELSACLDGLEFIQKVAPQYVDDSPMDQPVPPSAWPGAARTLGDFRILRKIGQGGMGVVYEAEQFSLQRRVALKVLPFAAMLDPRQLKRFHTEAAAAAGLHHTNIVPVFSVGCERSVHFYAMQYIEGATLAEVIRQLRQQDGLQQKVPDNSHQTVGRVADSLTAATDRFKEAQSPREERTAAHSSTPDSPAAESREPDSELPVAISTARSTSSRAYFRRVAELCVQVAEALDYAHQEGVVHRDVKPSNLILDERGNVWVTDFGLAYVAKDPGLTRSGDIVGTLRYMSPEQALAKRVTIDHRSDIYSLGVTLYELLTLRPAFAADDCQELLRQVAFEEPRPIRHWNKRVPAELETIVLKATVKNPDGRYATAQELADDLRRFLEHKPIHAKRPTLMDRAAKWSRRHVAFVWSAVIILALATVGSLFASLRISKSHDEELAARTKAEQNLYVAHILLAPTTMNHGQIGALHDLLDSHFPQPGQTDMRGWEWYYYLSRCHQDVMTLYGHTDVVESVAWSPSADRLATASRDGTIVIWDAVNGRVIKTLGRDHNRVFAVDWSPDGQQLVSAGEFGEILVWDVAAGKPIRLWFDECEAFGDVAWSADGKHIATAAGGHASIWQADSGSLVRRLSGVWNFDSAWELAWSPDGRRLAYGVPMPFLTPTEDGGRDGIVLKIWDVQHDRELCELGRDSSSLEAVAWNPDGTRLAAAFFTGIRLWDVTTGEEIQHPSGYSGYTRSLAWSPDGKFLASTGSDNQVKVWDVDNDRDVTTLCGHVGSVSSVAWSSRADRLATGGMDSLVKVWDVERQVDRVSKQHESAIRGLAWSPDGQYLASASDDDYFVKIWDPDTDQDLKALQHERGAPLTYSPNRKGLAWSPDGSLLATGDNDSTVRLWNTTSWTEVTRLTSGMPVHCLAWSPDGMTLAGVGRTRLIVLWDPQTGRELVRTFGNTHFAANLSWNLESDRLATGAWQQLIIRDATTGRRVQSFEVPYNWSTDYPIATAGWSPDGERLAAFSGNLLWFSDTSTGNPVLLLRGHTGPIFCADWSPDGRRFASTAENEAILWDATTGQQLVILDQVIGKEPFIAWCPDGKRLALGGSDGVITILDSRAGYDMADGPEYLFDEAYRLAATDRRDEAVDLLWHLAADFPDNPRFARAALGQLTQARLEKAKQLAATDRADDATEVLNKLAAEFPDDPRLARAAIRQSAQVQLDKAKQLVASNHSDEAIRSWQQVAATLADDPGFARFATSQLSVACSEVGDSMRAEHLDEAIVCYRKAIELDPNRVATHANLGLALLRQGKLDEAMACCRHAVELDPRDAESRYRLGAALARQDKLDEAIVCYHQAIELNPGSYGAQNDLGLALAQQGKLDEAIACYRRAIDIDPRYPLAHSNLGMALETQGKSEEAIASFHLAIELHPKDAWKYNNLAWLLATTDDIKFRNYAEALELAQQAIQLDPQSWRIWDTLSVAAYRAGEWQTSLDARHEKLQRHPMDSEDRLFLAMTHWQLGRHDQACEYFVQTAGALDQNNQLDQVLLRDEMETLIDAEVLIRFCTARIESEPASATLLMVRASARARSGQLELAAEDYAQALLLHPIAP